jgi:GGDEF domain-containing protein
VSYPVSVSIGLPVYQPAPDHECSLDELMERTDQAMDADQAHKRHTRRNT